MATRRFIATLIAAIALVLSGCGGSATPVTVVPPSLVSISLSPQSPAISVGMNQQFTAVMGSYTVECENLATGPAWDHAGSLTTEFTVSVVDENRDPSVPVMTEGPAPTPVARPWLPGALLIVATV